MPIRDLIHFDRPSNIPVRQRHRFGHSLMSLQEDMNQLFQDFFGDNALTEWAGRVETFPAVDIIENGKNFKVKADLSGIDPENVDVSVTDGLLTIKGERKEEKEEAAENYLRREMSYGAFQRTVPLPEAANCDKAEASFKNGILTVQVPKKEGSMQEPKKLPIKKAA